NDKGTFQIYNEATPGFSRSDILAKDNYLLIAQVIITTNVVAAASVIDARFLINDIEQKFVITVDGSDSKAGLFTTIESAIGYQGNFSSDPAIFILSDITTSISEIPENQKLIFYGDATFSSA